MKKNKVMRIAAVLLVAVLLSTCAISGTFAKYTTEAAGTDTARVAKWGFKTTTLTLDLFNDTYTNVASNDSTNVVAPGTTGSYEVVILPEDQAAPEVAYSFDINVDSTGSDATLLGKIVWSLNGTKCGTNGTFAELQAAVDALDEATVAAGSVPATKKLTIGWTWAFDGDDVSDTALGNADTPAELAIELSFTATQID